MVEYWTEIEDWPLYLRQDSSQKPARRILLSDDEAFARLSALETALAAKGFGSEPANG